MSSNAPHNTLTIANLGQSLTQGFELYRNHWKDYGKLAIAAFLWACVPIYGWSRYRALKLAIAHHALAKLRHDVPQTAQDHYHALGQQRSQLFWLQVFVWLRVWGWGLITLIGSAMVLGLLLGLAAIVLANPDILETSSNTGEPGWMILVFAGTAYAISGAIASWKNAALFLADFPLITKQATSIQASLDQSKRWSQGIRLPIQGLILTVLLSTLPLITVCLLPATVVATAIQGSWDTFMNFPATLGRAMLIFHMPLLWAPTSILLMLANLTSFPQGWLSSLSQLFYGLSLITGIITIIPLWQTVRAALYHQLSCQKDGSDLSLNLNQG